MMQSRTHTCGQLRLEQVGQTVTLAGFMENVREVGGSLDVYKRQGSGCYTGR